MIDTESTPGVGPRQGTVRDEERTPPRQRDLPPMRMPTQRQVKALSLQIHEVGRRMHQHEAYTLGAGESRVGVRLT